MSSSALAERRSGAVGAQIDRDATGQATVRASKAPVEQSSLAPGPSALPASEAPRLPTLVQTSSGSTATGPQALVKASKTFPMARKALAELLENFSFVQVVSVQESTSRGAQVFMGEAVELTWRRQAERPKLVFFDKFGRTRGHLKVGPISVAQCPLGPDHPTSVPCAGEILMGSLVPNTRKSHLEHVLRGWTSEAKPLWELLRLLKFGTKASEFECRSILLQKQALLMSAPSHVRACRDDIYMTARVILWASIRPLQVLAASQEPERWTLKESATAAESANAILISSKASAFIDLLVTKLVDPDLSEAFLDGLEQSAPQAAHVPAAMYDPTSYYGATAGPSSVPPQTSVPMMSYPVHYGSGMGPAVASTAGVWGQHYYMNMMPVAPVSAAAPAGGQTPVYSPPSPVDPSKAHNVPDGSRTPLAYAPTSPTYAPTSPTYAPTSPTYAPTSPTYAPSSPTPVAKGLYDDIEMK